MFKGRKTRESLECGNFTISNASQLKTKVDKNGRVCTKCEEYKTWDNFSNSKKTVTGKASSCKVCNNKHTKATRPKRNTKTERESNRASREFLKKNDPLKLKARNLRSGMRARSTENLYVPAAKEIEEWLKGIKNFVCYYTGVPLKYTDFSVDHKQPLNRGGTNTLDNLCICTKQINTTKGTMTEKEFKSLLKFLEKWEDGGASLLRRLRMAGKAFGR